MTRVRTHLFALVLFLVAFLCVLAFAGCGSTVDKQGDAYKTVVHWTTDLQKRDFYATCSLESKALNAGLGKRVTNALGISYSDLRACAISYEANEAGSIVLYGAPFYEGFVVDPKPVSNVKAPKNGYVFHVKYGGGDGSLLVSVQRDANGDWKIVGVEAG